MISKEDIKKLADLARIDVREDELENIRAKMEGVLSYVSEVQEITSSAPTKEDVPVLHNVLREDGEPEISGSYTDAILANAPEKEGHYIKVRKIL